MSASCKVNVTLLSRKRQLAVALVVDDALQNKNSQPYTIMYIHVVEILLISRVNIMQS